MNIFNENKIVIQGAREHNLKNINVEIPRNKLVVVSGLSGSGKSSLAFDTLFAEGQRRYMESLSSYARQFLGRMDKPDVDLITGLSPAIAIEQKTTHKNPRSTVGTVTEIYDYYRLLFSRIGTAHCPQCGREIKEQSIDQIISSIMSWPEGTKLTVLAPVIKGKKGEHQKIIDDAKKSGFIRARIDGLMVELEDSIKLDKQKKHTIEIVVDRIVLKSESRKRLADSVETALNHSNGTIVVLKRVYKTEDKFTEEEVFFSQKNACPDCGISIPELQPRLFSFNNPFGACPDCSGLGEKMEFDRNLIIPDMSLSFNEGAITFYNPDSEWNSSMFGAIAKEGGFTLDTPLKDLSKKQFDYLWNSDAEKDIQWTYRKQSGEGYSNYKRPWPGVISDMTRRYNEAWGDSQRERIEEKYHAHKFIAYFQNYTNTFQPLEHFTKYLREAAAVPDIVEISVSTRPDCLNREYLDVMDAIQRETGIQMNIELGLQTVNYHTLDRIGRGHGLAEFLDAVLMIKEYKGFTICAHVILNLPGDDRNDACETARVLTALGIDIVKLHSLYIAKNTLLCDWYENGRICLCSKEEYLERVASFLELIPENMAVERLFSRIPEKDSVFCNWGNSWWKLRDELFAKMKQEGRYQGRLCNYLNGAALKKLDQ